MKNTVGNISNHHLSTIFRVLGDPIRFDIVSLLLKKEKHLSCADYDVAKSTLSHHLKLLKEAGIISVKKEGVSHAYSLDPTFVKEYPELIALIKQHQL